MNRQMVKLKDEPLDSRIVSHFLSKPLSDGGQHCMFENLTGTSIRPH